MSCTSIRKRMMATSHINPVWQYFTVISTNNERVSCNLCNASMARGTSDLQMHLKKSPWRISCIDERCEKVMVKNNAIVNVDVIIWIVICVRSRQSTNAVEQPQGKWPGDIDDLWSRHMHRLRSVLYKFTFYLLTNMYINLSLIQAQSVVL